MSRRPAARRKQATPADGRRAVRGTRRPGLRRVTASSSAPPAASIIIPCFNEARTIGLLLQAIADQTVGAGSLEVVLADGGSTDGTRDVALAFGASHPELSIRLIANPARAIPAALNRAIEASRGPVVIRLDAHSIPQPDYVETCLRLLRRPEVANAGGVWEIHPSSGGWIARGIAAAASHRLGAGDARYRTSGQAGPVDTVPFGAFPRRWLERAGSYDERLLTNEDYEYNARLRRLGGLIWFDPAIRSIYFARATLGALARQYARYGYWKAHMLRRHPGTLRWRQALPPAFVLTALGLALAAPWLAAAGWLLGLQWALYAAVLAGAGARQAVRGRDFTLAAGVPLALAVMHLAWGSAFWWGWLSTLRRGMRESAG